MIFTRVREGGGPLAWYYYLRRWAMQIGQKISEKFKLRDVLRK